MKQSEDLFNLIKSLKRTEKTYFKKFSQFHIKGGQNNYVRIYDAIENQKTYDEKKLLDLFKGEPLTNQFWVAKNYLYNLILRSLELYHSSVDSELQSMLHRLEILYNKSLFDQCEKIVEKGIQQSLNFEKHLMLSEFLNWKMKLFQNKAYSGVTMEQINEVYSQLDDAAAKWRNYNDYSRLINVIYKKRRKSGFVRTEDQADEYEQMIRNPLFSSEEKAKSFLAKNHYFTVYITYYFTKNNFDKALQYSNNQISTFDHFPIMRSNLPFEYFIALKNNALINRRLFQYEEVIHIVEKLNAIDTSSDTLKNKIIYAAFSNELVIRINLVQIDAAEKIADRIIESLEKNKIVDKADEVTIYYNISVLKFLKENYKEANYWLGKIINELALDVRSDFQSFARILRLIIHYEMGKIDLVEYSIKSTYRFLSKKNMLYKTEKILLNFIRTKVQRLNNSASTHSAFKQLKMEITEAAEDIKESAVLNYFDFISWLESKIENRSFADVTYKKAQAYRK